MRKSVYLFLLVCVTSFVFGSCRMQNKDMEALQTFVEQINSKGETELPNGTILTKCEYKAGDSLLTYYIKVKDKRFDGVSVDSLKNSLAAEHVSGGNQKLTNLLMRNAVGLRYVYDTESQDITIVITSDELSQKK